MVVSSENNSPRGAGRSARQQVRDDLVMATNSSSIVSKRSVERIYYPDEPHFFRFFVKKFQRRAPLINRGYHLRMHIIDVAVRRFLQRPSQRKKVIVNLGCGSDVLPWQCLTRYPDHCHHAKFVDIDFPDLMTKKSRIVQETPELISPLSGIKATAERHVLFQSDEYAQIGCDLRDLASIERSLSALVSFPDSEFLFVAEVSITYMETEAADGVIRWASSLGQAEFCLLEQIVPDGPDHPFAKTMLRHFEKLKTPLKSVSTYPDLEAQHNRFYGLGWAYADVESLWQAWSNNQWLSPEERRKLDRIEPFDEWEEFALFASHYCIVTAKTDAACSSSTGFSRTASLNYMVPAVSAFTQFSKFEGSRGQRRFGATMAFKDELGQRVIANTFGLGTSSRPRSYDLYSQAVVLRNIEGYHPGPPSRMCHAVTSLGSHGNLLSGGRTSPTTALRDCWLFTKGTHSWTRLEDLPIPLYRHVMTRLGRSNMALLIGGKTGSSSIFGGCLLYRPGSGWVECKMVGSEYQPTFGAALVGFSEVNVNSDDDPSNGTHVRFRGILAGGLLEDGTVAKQVLRWNVLLPTEDGHPIITFESLLKQVTIHKAIHSKMDFNAKNFVYVTVPFGDFMQSVSEGNKMYLRALSEDQPAERPANLKTDFPQLADDFQLPEELSLVTENVFSSVLRISGSVNMWLHYDVMANVYCQVVGSKRLILFPPSDVTHLSFAPGSSSSSVDVFSELESSSISLAQTHPHEATLNPGDILFLPPLWPHTATPLTDLGVAVNIFFRSLESGYSSGRDVYGNRDLAGYEKGRQDVARIANAFSKIPPEMRGFYITRLADELKQKSVE
ncbi:hypothetical protein DL770_004716 [Monosporascus sp. CRB-9-2]|nr:hypothetical protein DL770_004716 [Monosporascus sp. CRB-9-2]